jgi:L-asparaginase II
MHHGNSVVSYRGSVIENTHGVHAAVVDASGRLLYSVGNPSRVTLARSAAKPAQALAILETGGMDQFGLDKADIALVCASHNSEDKHISRARAMLSKIDATEEDLRCGGHPALSPNVNKAWIKQDYVPTGICNNCSGKHAGMLAGARVMGGDITNYHLPDHPLQVRVKRTVEELCGLSPDDIEWSIDGCNLPAPAFPLYSLGKIYATLAAAADDAELESHPPARTVALARIFNAMVSHPDMVAGEGRFCTMLMTAFGGALIGKLGADGCYGVGIRSSQQTLRLGADGAIGISVKIEDGNIDILYAVVVEILERLSIGTADTLRFLDSFHKPKYVNTMGTVTGHISHSFELTCIDTPTTLAV